MADTVRTLSALQTLLADNTTGDISPQDVRDMLVSVYQLDYSADISITGAATATIGKWHICTGTTSDYTLTLPAVSGNAGKLIGLRMSSALTKLVTIDGNASETIDGELTRVMWANETAILFCDGTRWTKIAGKSIPMIGVMAKATTQTAVTTATSVKYLVDTIISEVGGICDTTNKRINIRRAGIYKVVSAMRFAQTAGVELTNNVSRLIGFCEVNGSSGTFKHVGEISALAGAIPNIYVASESSYSGGDYIEPYGYHNNSGNLVFEADGTTSNSVFSVTETSPW